MSAEPVIDRALLIQALRSAYGLDVDRLDFLPDGTMPAYRADGPGGRYFVKVLPNTPSGRGTARRVIAEIPLLRALRGLQILPNVPEPISTHSGTDLAEVDHHTLVVHTWIEGVNLGDAWTAALGDLAPQLGRLHAGTAQVMARVPDLPVPPEDFELPFEQTLLGDLAQLHMVPADAPPGVLALRALVLPHVDTIQERLTRLKVFQQAAQARPRPFVLCHTDAHGGNVMRDAAGQLWIIDWETARLAPPEHDLWMLGNRLADLLPAYESVFGQPAHLDPDLFGFYVYRRVLEDLAVDVGMILHENTRPEQDQANLTVIEQHVLPGMARAEHDLETLRAALDTHRERP